MFRAKERVAMLPERLQRAERPAEALANELAWSFRSFGPGDGLLVIANAPAGTANGDGEIGVFGNGVSSDASDRLDNGLSPSTESTGDDGDAIEKIERSLLHVLAGDVLKSLPASEPAATVADFDVTGDRGNFGIRKVTNELGDRVRFNLRVRIDGDNDFALRF